MTELELARRAAAAQAVKLIRDGYTVGLGSGATMALAVREIAALLKGRSSDVCFVPTSHQIELVALSLGLKLVSLSEHPELDLSLDSADEVDDALNLIKGGGAAMTREKIVASVSKRFVVIVDEHKRVRKLRRPVPIEVLPFAYPAVKRRVEVEGGRATIREGEGKVGPVITDNGNFVIDADFGIIEKPAELEKLFDSIPGIVESGLFVNMADEVYVGKLDGTVELVRRMS